MANNDGISLEEITTILEETREERKNAILRIVKDKTPSELVKEIFHFEYSLRCSDKKVATLYEKIKEKIHLGNPIRRDDKRITCHFELPFPWNSRGYATKNEAEFILEVFYLGLDQKFENDPNPPGNPIKVVVDTQKSN